MRLTQITRWTKEDETVETIQGPLSVTHWCSKVAERIRIDPKSPGRTAEVHNKIGYVAVFATPAADLIPRG